MFHWSMMPKISMASLAWNMIKPDLGPKAAAYRLQAVAQASEAIVKGLETIDKTLFHAANLAVPAGFLACKALFNSILVPFNLKAWANSLSTGERFQWQNSDGITEFVVGSMGALSAQESASQLQVELTRRALAVFSPFADASDPTDPAQIILRTNLTILQQRLELMESNDTPPVAN